MLEQPTFCSSQSEESSCITCRDEATPVLILAILQNGLALADRNGAIEEINVELCDAAVGDTVLVHAGTAIAKLAAP